MKIYPKYISSKTGIETILKITDTLKMCEGVKISTPQSVACSRFQTIEKFEHTTDDEEKENCSTFNRIIRSTLCSRFLLVTFRSNMCRNCQKMTLSDKKGQTSNAKPEEIVTADQSVTEADIKKLLPSASESMITLLPSQVKNLGRNPKGKKMA